MNKIYIIYANKNECVSEGYVRAEVIEKAEDYFRRQAEANEQWGDGEKEAELVTVCTDDSEEKIERITLSWHAEKDTYDGGRFDYHSSRGCKHG